MCGDSQAHNRHEVISFSLLSTAQQAAFILWVAAVFLYFEIHMLTAGSYCALNMGLSHRFLCTHIHLATPLDTPSQGHSFHHQPEYRQTTLQLSYNQGNASGDGESGEAHTLVMHQWVTMELEVE